MLTEKNYLSPNIAAIILLGIATGIIFTALLSNSTLHLLALLVLPLLILLSFKYPEIFFALFITAGVYKADPRLSFLPEFFDLTIFFEVLTFTGVLYKILAKKLRLSLPPKIIFLPYLFLCVMGILSLSYTPAPIYGADKTLRLLIITTPAFLLPVILLRDEKAFHRFFAIFIILAIIMVCDILNTGLAPSEIGMHSALGGNYLAVGRIGGLSLIILLFCYYLTTKIKLLKLLYTALILFIICGILLAGGRGPLVAFLISIVFTSFYFFKFVFTLSMRKLDIKPLVLLLSLSILSIITISYFQDYFTTIFTRSELIVTLEGDSIQERLHMFRKALHAMSEFPEILIGLGIGGFTALYGDLDTARGTYPHNIFLEFGSEFGLLCLIVFIFLIWKTFHLALYNVNYPQSEHNHYMNIALLATFIFMIINASVSGDINDNRLLFTSIGLIIASYGKKNERL